MIKHKFFFKNNYGKYCTKTGIKCKKIPARFEPIIEIPFIQRIKDANPGKSTTYVNVKTKGN